MRRDWWLVIILLVAFIFAIGTLFFFEGGKSGTQEGRTNLAERGDDFDVNPDDSVVASGVDVSGGGSGARVEGDAIIGGDGVVIAPNVSAFECGYYFEGYGVCAGTCPDGVCVSEDRSCYCKKT